MRGVRRRQHAKATALVPRKVEHGATRLLEERPTLFTLA